jgi:hypothetical protein
VSDSQRGLDLPRKRDLNTYELVIMSQTGRFKFYLAVSRNGEGHPVEIWVDCAKEGTMLREFMHGWAALFSIALQHRVPLDHLIGLYKEWQFEPCGAVQGFPGITTTPSVLSLVVSILEKEFPKESTPQEGQTDLFPKA